MERRRKIHSLSPSMWRPLTVESILGAAAKKITTEKEPLRVFHFR